MTYEWGTRLVEPTAIIEQTYEMKKGEAYQYIGTHEYTFWGAWDKKIPEVDLEKDIVLKLADKAKAEGQEPIYFKCVVIQYFWNPLTNIHYYKYENTIQVRCLKASPVAWYFWVVAILLIAIASYLMATTAEKIWAILVEAGQKLASFLGIPAEAGTGLILMVIVAVIVVVMIGVMSVIRR